MNRKKLRLILALGAALRAAGCAAPPEHDVMLLDLRLLSLETAGDAGHQQFTVRFATKTDLAAFVRAHDRTLGFNIWPCRLGRGQAAYYKPDPNIYDRFGEVATDKEADKARGVEGVRNGPYIFHFAVAAADGAYKPPISYDLAKTPEDMCFFVGGWNPNPAEGPHYVFSSNTVVILADAVKTALKLK
jgi:hypothetical protein